MRILLIFLLGTLMSCGKSSPSGSHRQSVRESIKVDEVGIWESKCIEVLPKRKIVVEFKANGGFSKHVDYFGVEEGCSPSDIQFSSSEETTYTIGKAIQSNIYELNLTDDLEQTMYYSIKIKNEQIQLSNGASYTPNARVISFVEEEKLYQK